MLRSAGQHANFGGNKGGIRDATCSDLLRAAAVAGLAGWVLGGLGSAADAQERVRWKLASSYTSTLDVLGQNILRVVENIETMSDGNFEIQFNEPGALVPALEVFDAVSKGSMRGVLHLDRLPCRPRAAHDLLRLGAVRAERQRVHGLDPHGGGKELYDECYGEHNIKGFQCGIVVAEFLGLVPQGDQVARRSQGPEDALLRPRRQGHGQARRLDPAARRRRHLSGARARRDRRDRVLLPLARQVARLLRDRQAQLLPGLASAGLVRRADHEHGRPGTRCRRATRRSSRSPATRPTSG